MNNTQERLHRVITVAALTVGPLSLVVATVIQWLIHPATPSSTIFDMIAENRTIWTIVGLISVLGPLCWLAGLPAIIASVRGRGWTLTTVGGYLTAVGLAAAIGHLASYFAVYGVGASSGLDGDGLQALERAISQDVLSNLLLVLFLAFFSVGPILMTVGLRRAKLVAVWVPVAAIVMTVANFAGGVPAGIVQLCALVLTFAPIIVAVLRAPAPIRGTGRARSGETGAQLVRE